MSELKQIGRPSSAKMTAFVSEELDVGGGLSLHLDGNQKVSGWVPRPNALSVLDRDDCPWRTSVCEKACYVSGLAAAQPELHAKYRHNSGVLHGLLDGAVYARTIDQWFGAAGGSGDKAGAGQVIDRVTYRLADWIAANCGETGFRWHVSGDVFSLAHAEFIAQVVRRSAAIRHWIYTRSFHLLEPLVAVSTARGGPLALNLSGDRDNYWIARRLADQHGLRVCYLTVAMGDVPGDLNAGDVVFPDYALRPPAGGGHAPSEQRLGSPFWESLDSHQRSCVCPVDMYSKSERIRCSPEGACARCLS